MLGNERSSRVTLRGDRIATECCRVHYKMHYLRDTFAVALRPAIFLAGERFYIARTVVDRKSAYRYHRTALLFPSTLHPSSHQQIPPLVSTLFILSVRKIALCHLARQTDASLVKLHDTRCKSTVIYIISVRNI